MKSRLLVTFHGGGAPNTSEVFRDWFDFADYIKEQNLAGYVVHILSWEYV